MHNITSILLIDGREAVIVFPIEVLSQTVGKLSYFSAFNSGFFFGQIGANAINSWIIAVVLDLSAIYKIFQCPTTLLVGSILYD